eukprot:TRINITY_DN16579_c0_g2_i1.p1 TRINITY_DN16579_c0_g2~~TRINITY_DN16579_c0_g2_i1.p1  ORF type:complete len:589 (+),score=94.98 TRINITY_DN16579_c0_g2_i1:159-1925(+)
MILYDTGKLHFLFAFQCRGSVIHKGLLWGIPTMIASMIVHVLRSDFGLDQETIGLSQAWNSYNFVVGFLVVFRTQQAYSRFWSGATSLQQTRGEWFNACSSLFAFSTQKQEKQAEVKRFHQFIVRLFSLLWCTGLEQLAGAEFEFKVLDLTGLDPIALDYIRSQPNRCEVILQWIQRSTTNAVEAGILTAPPPVLSRVYQELSRGIVNLNQVQTIIDIIFPFPYAQLVTFSVTIHSVLMPFIAAATVPELWWASLLTFITVTALWSINYTAGELENPFGNDANDLPIKAQQLDFNVSLSRLLDPVVNCAPEFQWSPEEEDDEGQVKMQPWNDARASAAKRATEIKGTKRIFKARSKYFDFEKVASMNQISKIGSLRPSGVRHSFTPASRQSPQLLRTPDERPQLSATPAVCGAASGAILHKGTTRFDFSKPLDTTNGSEEAFLEPNTQHSLDDSNGSLLQLQPESSNEFAAAKVLSPASTERQQHRLSRKQQRQAHASGALKKSEGKHLAVRVDFQEEPEVVGDWEKQTLQALPSAAPRCSICDAALSQGAVFCENCGAKTGRQNFQLTQQDVLLDGASPEPPLAAPE